MIIVGTIVCVVIVPMNIVMIFYYNYINHYLQKAEI